MSRLQVRFLQGVLGGDKNMKVGGAFSVLFGILWFGVVVYMISLVIRFVKAVEKIADRMK